MSLWVIGKITLPSSHPRSRVFVLAPKSHCFCTDTCQLLLLFLLYTFLSQQKKLKMRKKLFKSSIICIFHLICSIGLFKTSFAATKQKPRPVRIDWQGNIGGGISSITNAGMARNKDASDYNLYYDYMTTMHPNRVEQGDGVALIRKLFSNYHKATQPVRPLVVHMDVLLIKVKNTVEKEGIFESVVALFIEWTDKRLSWDPRRFENITYLSLDPETVGLPDIAMTNSAQHLYAITRDHRFNVRVTNEGYLKYVPTGTARTWCDLKLVTFPFDFQKCSLEFESWSLDSSMMTFDGMSELLLDTSFVSESWTICEWKAIVSLFKLFFLSFY